MKKNERDIQNGIVKKLDELYFYTIRNGLEWSEVMEQWLSHQEDVTM